MMDPVHIFANEGYYSQQIELLLDINQVLTNFMSQNFAFLNEYLRNRPQCY